MIIKSTSLQFILFIFTNLLMSCNNYADEGIPDILQMESAFFTHTNKTHCSPLPPATGNILRVNPFQTERLQSIVSTANPGDTILMEDGVYNLDGIGLQIATHNITLRSASGNPESVILNGSYKTKEILSLQASNIKIAELTLTKAYTHPIHVISSDSGDTINTLIYRVNIVDPREQAIKINTHRKGYYVDLGTIACSTITLTDQGRTKVNPALGGCYTGGIDAHQAWGWTIRDNFINGFWCPMGLSEYAIHFWRGSRDTTVERNVLLNNARGIGLGMMNEGKARTYNDNYCPEAKGAYIGHYGGMVRNNLIHASSPALFKSADGFDCGICLWSACKSIAVHNSIVSTDRNYSSIEWRFAGSKGVQVYNNIVTHPLRQRDGASAYLNGNLQNADLSIFIDGQNGDLHLKPTANSAINKGVKLYKGIADLDIDNESRDTSPDIGIDEISL